MLTFDLILVQEGLPNLVYKPYEREESGREGGREGGSNDTAVLLLQREHYDRVTITGKGPIVAKITSRYRKACSIIRYTNLSVVYRSTVMW